MFNSQSVQSIKGKYQEYKPCGCNMINVVHGIDKTSQPYHIFRGEDCREMFVQHLAAMKRTRLTK